MSDEVPRGKASAIALLSEGLDGVLAARLMEAQGVEVRSVHFRTGFARGDRPPELDRGRRQEPSLSPYSSSFRERTGLAASCEIVDVAAEYLERVVLHPRHGFGSALNPCIDCRIFMLRKAEEIRRERKADLIVTGEVLGQDRMSQKRAALETVARESGVLNVLLRPLSARLLKGTGRTDSGVDGERLGSIHGRARHGQAELARAMAIGSPPAPTLGCCLLADAGFARRLRDLLSHRDPGTLTREDIDLLRVGRHFRIAHDLKVIVGRDEAESSFLKRRAADRWTCQVASGHGALGLVEGSFDGLGTFDNNRSFDKLGTVAGLAVRYSRERGAVGVEVVFRRREAEVCCTAAAATDTGRLLL